MALVKVEKTSTINNITACQIDNRSQADLLIFVTDLRGISHNKEYIWTYVESEGEADLRICWDENSSKGLKVCLVDNIALAGWVNTNHLHYKRLCN